MSLAFGRGSPGKPNLAHEGAGGKQKKSGYYLSSSTESFCLRIKCLQEAAGEVKAGLRGPGSPGP